MTLEEEIKQKAFKNHYQKLAVNLIYTGNWFYAYSTQQFKAFGVSQEQYNILRILRGQHPQPATVNLLIDRMLNKMSNASRLVEKLRQKGLVERRQCEEDRRAVDVYITELGLKLLEDIDKKEITFTDPFDHLTESEVIEFNRLLDKVRNR